jgi:hypothetical protein
VFEIEAKIFCGDKGFFVVDPKEDFIALPQKLNENLN